MPQNTIIARFAVTGWDETSLPGVEGGWASGAVLPKTFSEGITGSSVALFISSGEQEGQRAYIAAERITGTFDDGRSGSFTVHHGGLESDPATWFGHVVPGSGTGDLVDLASSARIEHDENGAFFAIEPAS
jgi:hypothetical protein